MKDVKSITDIIQQARLEAKRTEICRRKSISPEQFRELFIIRATQVMEERRVFSNFVIDNENSQVLNLFYQYVVMNAEKINPVIGIILNGRYGCGKSIAISALCRVLNDLRHPKDDAIVEYHALELCELILENGVTPYARIPLLIQDIGKEMKSAKSWGTDRSPLTELFATRSEYGSLTFGSMNYSKEDFEKNYKSLGKRVFEHVTIIFLPGENRRKDFSINQPKN